MAPSLHPTSPARVVCVTCRIQASGTRWTWGSLLPESSAVNFLPMHPVCGGRGAVFPESFAVDFLPRHPVRGGRGAVEAAAAGGRRRSGPLRGALDQPGRGGAACWSRRPHRPRPLLQVSLTTMSAVLNPETTMCQAGADEHPSNCSYCASGISSRGARASPVHSSCIPQRLLGRGLG